MLSHSTLKRLIVISIGILVLLYLVSGVYFYKTSFEKSKRTELKQAQIEIDTTKLVILKEVFKDFENDSVSKVNSIWDKSNTSISFHFSPKKEYGIEISCRMSEIPSWNTIKCIDISMKLLTKNQKNEILSVIEIDGEDGKIASWVSDNFPNTKGKWQNYSYHFDIDSQLVKKNAYIKVYAWNKNKNNFYIDDVSVKYSGWKTNSPVSNK